MGCSARDRNRRIGDDAEMSRLLQLPTRDGVSGCGCQDRILPSYRSHPPPPPRVFPPFCLSISVFSLCCVCFALVADSSRLSFLGNSKSKSMKESTKRSRTNKANERNKPEKEKGKGGNSTQWGEGNRFYSFACLSCCLLPCLSSFCCLFRFPVGSGEGLFAVRAQMNSNRGGFNSH